MVTCIICKRENDKKAEYCIFCGTSLSVQPGVAPSVKPVPSVRVVSPVAQPGAAVRVPPPGMCYYHPNLPAVYVCNRCGRPICRDCAKPYSDLVLCPQCCAHVSPGTITPVYQPPLTYQPPPSAVFW